MGKQTDHKAKATFDNPLHLQHCEQALKEYEVCAALAERSWSGSNTDKIQLSPSLFTSSAISQTPRRTERVWIVLLTQDWSAGTFSMGFLLSTQSSCGRKHDMWIRLCIRHDPTLIRQAALLNLIQCSRDQRGAPSDCICCSVTVYVPSWCVNAHPPHTHLHTHKMYFYRPKREQ